MATATTDRQADGRGAGNRAPARGPRLATTALGALSAFLGAFAFLSWQMGSGNDPALGAVKPAPPAPVRREIVVRKVVITKVRPERVIVRERVAAALAPQRSIPAVRRVAVPAAAPPPAPVSHTTSRPAPKPQPKPAPAASEPAPPTTHQS